MEDSASVTLLLRIQIWKLSAFYYCQVYVHNAQLNTQRIRKDLFWGLSRFLEPLTDPTHPTPTHLEVDKKVFNDTRGQGSQCIQNYSIGSDKGRQKCVSNVQTKDLRPRHKEDSVSSSGLAPGKTMPRWLPSISYSSIQTTSSTDSSLMTLTRWKCLWFVFKFTSRRWLSDSVSSSVECMGFMYLVCIWYVFWNLIRTEWVSARISGDLMTNLYWLLIQEPSRQRL